MRYLNVLPLIFILSVLPGCKREKPSPPKGKVIAQVDSIYLEEEDLKVFNLDSLHMQSGMKDDIIDNWIKTSLFYLAALELKLDTVDIIKRKIEWAKKNLLAQEYLALMEKNLTVPAEEVDSILKFNRPFFETGVKLLVVFLEDSVRGVGIRKALIKGGRTEKRELRRLQDDPTVSVMYTGWVNLGSFLYEYQGIPEELLNELKTMKVGAVSGIYRSNGSYVLVKVLGRKKMEVDEGNLKSFLKGLLLYRKRAKLEDSLYNYLRTRYTVKVEGGIH